MRKRISLFVLTLSFCSISFAQLPKITFTPHWLPQAQFAGYYAALQKGFYHEEGIEVEIIHPSASIMATEHLVNEKSDVISLFMVTAIDKKNAGLDLVNIAQLSQNSALLFVSKKSSGIDSLDDIDGKRIGIWESGFDEIPKAIIKTNNFDITWVPVLSSINMLMVGGVDAMTVMWYNEYDQIINAGFNPDELNAFFFSDYNYNIPEDGIYCLNKTRLNRGDDLQKFVNGTLRGWEYAKDNKEEVLGIVLDLMKKNHIPTNLAHQSWMLDRILELMEPGEKIVSKGELAETDFDKTQSVLIETGYIDKKIVFEEFYKPVVNNRTILIKKELP